MATGLSNSPGYPVVLASLAVVRAAAQLRNSDGQTPGIEPFFGGRNRSDEHTGPDWPGLHGWGCLTTPSHPGWINAAADRQAPYLHRLARPATRYGAGTLARRPHGPL